MNRTESEQRRPSTRNLVSARFAATPQAVFAVLGNGWLYPAWVVGASRMREVEVGWPQPGSRLHHSFGVWPLLINDTTSVTEYQQGRRMVLRARGWPAGEASVTIALRAVDGGCDVSIDEDVIRGPGRLLLAPLRRAGVRRRNQETLRRLRFLTEGSAGGAAGR